MEQSVLSSLKFLLRSALSSRRLVEIAAVASLGTLTVLSLLPADQVTRTSLGGHLEHTIAYAGSAFLCAAGWRGGAEPRPVLFALFAYAGVLEFLQRYSPGRVSSLGDFAFSCAGILLGVSALMVIRARVNT
jgi:hypothetical protein